MGNAGTLFSKAPFEWAQVKSSESVKRGLQKFTEAAQLGA